MSIQINNLLKVYGQQRAVDGISFQVDKGEVVGFLGPNGAGKSTTMKIITSYLPPSAGEVLVEGMNVASQGLKVKKVIGYLPEHNPLYLELYVHEYLCFVGRLYGLQGKKLNHRIGEMIEMCGLTSEQNKRIESLSKGYRQRVGLAQALLHDPSVLILDEPTSGLDPNQIIEIRKLIKNSSTNKTVLFSTHIMQEVQALCDRVIVINKGQIVANDKLSTLLKSNQGDQTVVVEFEGEVSIDELNTLTGAIHVEALTSGKYRIKSNAGVDLRPEIFRLAADRNLSLVGLTQQENSLENIFKSLTSTSLQ